MAKRDPGVHAATIAGLGIAARGGDPILRFIDTHKITLATIFKQPVDEVLGDAYFVISEIAHEPVNLQDAAQALEAIRTAWVKRFNAVRSHQKAVWSLDSMEEDGFHARQGCYCDEQGFDASDTHAESAAGNEEVVKLYRTEELSPAQEAALDVLRRGAHLEDRVLLGAALGITERCVRQRFAALIAAAEAGQFDDALANSFSRKFRPAHRQTDLFDLEPA